MIAFKSCPTCGGELIHKEVEKLLRGGNHTAVLMVKADVCTRCGERLYDQDTIHRFEVVREKLQNQDTDDFKLLGQSFQVR